jgi:hypothetical protein
MRIFGLTRPNVLRRDSKPFLLLKTDLNEEPFTFILHFVLDPTFSKMETYPWPG